MSTLFSILSDTRLALKLFTKHKTLKIAVIATLALGIGANTAMFTVLDALLFPTLPYSHSKRLVIFQEHLKNGKLLEATSYPRFDDWRRSTHSFEQVAGESMQNLILSGNRSAEPVTGELVTADYFSILGVNAALGRTFSRDETSSAAAAPRAVISDGLWKRRFGADPDVVGKGIHLNGVEFTVIGVLPPQFQGISREAKIWIPITKIGVVSSPLLLQSRAAIWVTAIGLVRQGTSLQVAQQEVNAVTSREPAGITTGGVELIPLGSRSLQRYKEEAYVLFGAVLFVLLIATLNVANLLLGYFSDRKSELAVRNALGAPRRRLVQQLVTESVVLAMVGGALGVVLAFLLVSSLGTVITSVLPSVGPLGLNGRVFALTGTVSFLTGVLSGLLPLLQVMTQGMSDHLKGTHRTGTGRARTRLGTVLVIGQIGLAMVLVIGAGLMLQSISRLRNVHLGFKADGVLIARLSALPADRYDTAAKMENFYEALLDKLSGLPQVRSAGLSSNPPLLGPSPSIPFLIRGRSDMSANHPPIAQYVVVSHGYFSALSVPILAGRGIERSDTETTAPVVVINEAMRRQYWPAQDPIGQFLEVFDGGEAPKQIIGVIADVRDSALANAAVPEIYIPYTQVPAAFLSLLKSFPPALAVRTAGSSEPLGNAVRDIVGELDSAEAVLSTVSLRSVVSGSVAEPQLYTEVLGLFAGIALVLAAVGIYGVVSYSVTQQTQEIGVRMAMGATRTNILVHVLGRTMIFTVFGLILGTGGALAVTALLRSLLFEIRPHDPGTILAASLALATVSLIAAYVPARRASQINPNSALRL